MPSAPLRIARSTSSTLPALASTANARPSRVVTGCDAYASAAADRASASSIRRRYSAAVCSSGAISSSPAKPSSTTIVPSSNRSKSSPNPTTAGRFRLRARMARWLVALPRRVTTPRTREKSIRAVSDGASSSAARMLPSGIAAKGSVSEGTNCRRMRRHTSRTSSARARRYSSSICAKSAANSPEAAWTASAAVIPSAIFSATFSMSIGSAASSRCAAKISFAAASFSNSPSAAATAASKRDCSAGRSPDGTTRPEGA